MATAAVRRGAGAAAREWSTPRLLKAFRLALWVLLAGLLLAIVGATEVHRAALKTVSRDTVPSILTAQQLKSAIAGMDADAANELLAPGDPSPLSLQDFEAHRVEASRALIAAAENITFGDAERLPLQSLQLGLGTYQRLVQKAVDLHASNSAAAAIAYRDAARVMDSVLLPAADALDQANSEVLERSYGAEGGRSSGVRAVLALLALATLGTLLGAQMLLSQRMHRTLNPGLLGATAVLLCVALLAFHDVSMAHQDLRIAKEDSFSSVHTLLRARATAYAANSAESRYLLDPGQNASSTRAFVAEQDEIATMPLNLRGDQLLAALRNGGQVDGFSGYLATAIDHASFAGEREAALEALADWQRYVEMDGQMRRMERSGEHRKAVEFCMGTQPGESDWAFQQFDGALQKTLAIDEQAFASAVQDGDGALRSLEAEAVVLSLLAGVLVFLGFAPRLREYQ